MLESGDEVDLPLDIQDWLDNIAEYEGLKKGHYVQASLTAEQLAHLRELYV